MGEDTKSTSVDSSKKSDKYKNLIEQDCIPDINCVTIDGQDFEKKLKTVDKSDSIEQETEAIAKFGDVNISFVNITREQFEAKKQKGLKEKQEQQEEAIEQ